MKFKIARGFGSNIRKNKFKTTVPKKFTKIAQMSNISIYAQLMFGLNPKKNRKTKPGMAVLHEIRRLQKFIDFFIPKPFFSYGSRIFLRGRENKHKYIRNKKPLSHPAGCFGNFAKTAEYYVILFSAINALPNCITVTNLRFSFTFYYLHNFFYSPFMRKKAII